MNKKTGTEIAMPVAAGTYDYYLARYVLDEERVQIDDGPDEQVIRRWTLPAGTVGRLDIGPSDKDSQQGWCICWLVAGSAAPAESTALGDDLDGDVRTAAKTRIESALLLPAGSLTPYTSLREISAALLTTFSTVDGVDRCKPLVPTAEGELEVWMAGHSRVVAERFEWGVHPHTAKLRELMQAEYAKAKVQAALAEVTDRLVAEWLGYNEAKYARMGLDDYRELLPLQYRDTDSPLRPGTTAGDNFTNADDGNLEAWGGDGNGVTGWDPTDGDATSVIAWSSEDNATNVKNSGAQNRYNADSAVSGNDHTVQADVDMRSSTANNAAQWTGVMARCQSATSGSDYYLAYISYFDDVLHLEYRASSGSETEITTATPTVTSTQFTPQLLALTCNGSTISVAFAGTTDISETDTNVTSGLYGGIRGGTNSSVRDPWWDNWQIEDEGGAPAPGADELMAARQEGGEQPLQTPVAVVAY